MLNHFDIATEGIRKDHRWIARLGFFLLEIIPKPPVEGGGGGYGGSYYEPEEYIVRVSVTFKGKTFTQEKTMTAGGVKTLEKVVAFFRRAKPLYDRTEMFVKYMGKKIRDLISIKTFKRDRNDSK